MLKNILRALVLVVFCMVVYVPTVSAAGQKYEMKSVLSTVKDVLMENIGKMVIVQMDTGVNMEGIVSKVGKSEDGGCQVMVYNEIRDSFEAPHPSLAWYVFFPNDEAELVTGADFNAYVEELRVKEAAQKGAAPDVKDEP